MKTLVVYDSLHGNTEKVAKTIGDAIGGEVRVLSAAEAKPSELGTLDLLVVGSPTHRFKPTAAITSFLKSIPKDTLAGVKVAAFDTRFAESVIARIRILAFFVKIFGYAAKPIADQLVKKGGQLEVGPEGFCVGDTEGPLLDGELERAGAWAKQIVESMK